VPLRYQGGLAQKTYVMSLVPSKVQSRINSAMSNVKFLCHFSSHVDSTHVGVAQIQRMPTILTAMGMVSKFHFFSEY